MSRDRKGMPFLLAATIAATACAPDEPAEILWDTWGVPHIYADDPAELFYAFGWAQMESHGDLLLRLYGQARGRAAEHWGELFLPSDRWVHLMAIPERAASWYNAQSPDFKNYLDAFAAGINDYASGHGQLLDDAYEAVLPVSATDILAHSQRAINFTFVVNPGVINAGNRRLQAGSNAWAIAPSRSESGNAMLLANPHLPWSDLFTFFEAHLITDDVNVYGATLVGLPILVIAFNEHLGWTHTVNTHDGADLYELTLEGDGYRFDGDVRPFEVDTQTILVANGEAEHRVETFVSQKSVHGPVIAQNGARAIALRVVGLNKPDVIKQYWEMYQATDLEEFEDALRQMQMPMFTVMYADRDGHIMHLFGGDTPLRTGGATDDWSGVVAGDETRTLWTETHPYDDLPRIVDPPSGWLQNANDPPWTTTFPRAIDPADFPAYMAPRSMAFRPQRSARMLAEDDQISFEELVDYKLSTRMEMADRILDDLVPAARRSGRSIVREAADVLEAWDRAADADSRGAVLFAEWASEMPGRMFATPWNEDAPRSTPDGLANVSQAIAVLEQAATTVQQRYGSIDVPWGNVYRLRGGGHDFPGNGGSGQLGIFRVVGYRPSDDGTYTGVRGDSYVAMIEFSDPVRARVLLTYGNATQPHSPHAWDQLELFSQKAFREAWLTREDVEAHLGSRVELRR